MESPYLPPREVDPSEVSSMPLDPGVFRLDPVEQQMIGRLAKYLREIGGLLMLVAVLSLIGVAMAGVAAMSGVMVVAMGLQVVQQLASVVLLFLIGMFMRQAAVPLKAASETPEEHLDRLTDSMVGLKSLYGAKVLYLLLGIVGTVISLFV